MTVIEQAAKNIENLAVDNSHGYDQANRWGPDYDCSSAVITAWQNAGVPVKTYGASYTGNMYPVFKSCGFSDVTSQVNLATGAGLQRGDVLLNHKSHTAMYVGYGTIAHASLNENGGTTGGMTGDQTGREICLRSYYNFPWDVVLRYTKGGTAAPTPEPVKPSAPAEKEVKYCTVNNCRMPLLEKGARGSWVTILQLRLIDNGFTLPKYGSDGSFGAETQEQVEELQKSKRLVVDGKVGPATWGKLYS